MFYSRRIKHKCNNDCQILIPDGAGIVSMKSTVAQFPIRRRLQLTCTTSLQTQNSLRTENSSPAVSSVNTLAFEVLPTRAHYVCEHKHTYMVESVMKRWSRMMKWCGRREETSEMLFCLVLFRRDWDEITSPVGNSLIFVGCCEVGVCLLSSDLRAHVLLMVRWCGGAGILGFSALFVI